MKRLMDEQILLGAAILGLAGIAPNIFPVAQSGLAKMSVLGAAVLLPSLVLLAGTVLAAKARGHHALVRRVLVGTAAGILATAGLEVVRSASFRLGGMPGDLPRLMGVLLTDRFMVGPSVLSDTLGYAYHFWNGAVFGLIFALLLGRRPVSWYVGYGVLIGGGFLAGPAVSALGIGPFGLEMPSMPATVLAAHVVYGWVLGRLHRRWTAPERTTTVPVSLQWISTKPRPAVHEPNPEGDRCA